MKRFVRFLPLALLATLLVYCFPVYTSQRSPKKPSPKKSRWAWFLCCSRGTTKKKAPQSKPYLPKEIWGLVGEYQGEKEKPCKEKFSDADAVKMLRDQRASMPPATQDPRTYVPAQDSRAYIRSQTHLIPGLMKLAFEYAHEKEKNPTHYSAQ